MTSKPSPPFRRIRKALQTQITARWFAILDLGCVMAGLIFGRLAPHLAGEFLAIAFIPWGIRLISGQFPFRRTHLEGWVALFWATALLGAAISYQPGEAWAKFWLISAGILLFYALAGQPAQNAPLMAALVCLFAAGTALYFLMANDWVLFPAKLTVLNQVGLWWMKVRPVWEITRLYHNIAAGIIAFSLPFTAWLAFTAWRSKRWLAGTGLIFMGGLTLLGFLMTTSRGALLALFAGCMIGGFLWAVGKNLPFLPNPFIARYTTSLALLLVVFAACAFLFLAGPINLVESDPALSSSGSRLELFGTAVQLIADFPFTGGGLSTFPGMYSRYILGIPDFFYLSSHNLYLNIAHEQGPLGLLALAGFYLTIFIRLVRAKSLPIPMLGIAAITGLLIIMLHNLVDNILDDPGFAFLLFALPGVIAAILPQALAAPTSNQLPRFNWQSNKFRGAVIGILAVLIVAMGFRQPLMAAFYANRGALRMAQVELAGFPATQAAQPSSTAELSLAQVDFEQALELNPGNRTANHRLGLLAMKKLDFQSAAAALEAAYQSDSGHRGINKALGLSYVWLGRYEQALPLLRTIPESGTELDIYIWWWPTQNRPDLAEKATEMVHRLNLSPK